MKQIFILFFMGFLFSEIKAQVSETGYYITNDGKRYNGVTIMNPNYADSYERVRIAYEAKEIDTYFYPSEIAAYGINGGYKYISASIETDGESKDVFLKELIRDGDIILYKYVSKDNILFFTIDRVTGKYKQITDNGKEFRESLQRRAQNCEIINELNQLPMNMTESSLMSLYESYDKCSNNNNPGITFGISINGGYSFFNFDDKTRFDIKNQPYIMPGVFLDIPLDRRISFRPEIYYFFTKTSSKQYTPDLNMNSFEYKRHSIIVPLFLRYRFSNIKGNTIPYIEMGATLDFRISGNITTVENGLNCIEPRSVTSAYCLVGPEFGAGIQHILKNKRSIYAGIRSGYYFGSASTDKREHRTNISVNVGFGF